MCPRYTQYDLVGVGEPVGRIAFEEETLAVEGGGECTGIRDDLGRILIPILQHLVRRTEQPEERAQMVVAHVSGERPGLDVTPEPLKR